MTLERSVTLAPGEAAEVTSPTVLPGLAGMMSLLMGWLARSR